MTMPCATNPAPYDVLIENEGGRYERIAAAEAKALCDRCPLMDACHTEHRDEGWVKAIRRVPRPMSTEAMREAHATFGRLRTNGVARECMHPDIVQGERAYQAARHDRRRAAA